MESKLLTLKETTELLTKGRLLVIAAAENLLAQLPEGNWIGGSNPYLLGENGALYTEELLYVKDFTHLAVKYKMSAYDASTISKVTTDSYANGLIIAVFPAFSDVHREFSVKSPEFENQYINPLLGWVTGLAFEKMGVESPTTYIGAKRFTDKAAVLHIELPDDKVGRIEIVNPYEQGDGDEITFEHDGWYNQECLINGVRTNLFDYLQKRGDLYLPFVADYSGARINVAIMLDNENKRVNFFAPVFKNIVYKTARQVETDYISYLIEKLEKEKKSQLEYSYSCLYNYFNFQLEKKPIPGFVGTFTYGEIGYQLLNVTFVYLVIEDKV